MKAISIRQPWAWLIVNGYKDIENRDWPTHYRGRVLIHASKKKVGFNADKIIATNILWQEQGNPIIEDSMVFYYGGIVGAVDIVDCVDKSDSPWFFGQYGFVLKNPEVLPFTPMRGRLGLFNVSDDFQVEEMPV